MRPLHVYSSNFALYFAMAESEKHQSLQDRLKKLTGPEEWAAFMHEDVDKHDRVNQSLFRIEEDNEFNELARNKRDVGKRLKHALEFLDSLEIDSLLVQEFDFSSWNVHILEDALKLISTLLQFSKKLVKTFERFNLGNQGDLDRRKVQEKLETLENGMKIIVEGFKSGMAAKGWTDASERIDKMICIHKNDPISGATVREMVLRNELYRRREEFCKNCSSSTTGLDAGQKWLRMLSLALPNVHN